MNLNFRYIYFIFILLIIKIDNIKAQSQTLQSNRNAPLAGVPILPMPTAYNQNNTLGGGLPRQNGMMPMNGNVPMPPHNFGQQINIATPPIMPTNPPSIRKRVHKAINEFEDSQLSNSEIKRLKKLNIRNASAAMTPYTNIAKPVTRTLMVDLSPGVSAPVLRLSAGQLSTLVFSSYNGDPWYIENVKLNRNMFSDGMQGQNQNEENQTNILSLEPLKPMGYGNVSIQLKGLSTPIIFALTTGQKEVDFRVDVKVVGRNPDAVNKINYADKIPSLDESIPYFLDGVPPKEAKRLKVTGGKLEAWEYNQNMYIRTEADVQYPAYYSSAKSTSGLGVYRFNQIYNSITLLQNGRVYTLSIEQE